MTSPAQPENDSGPVTGLISKHKSSPSELRRKNEAGPGPRGGREVNPVPVFSLDLAALAHGRRGKEGMAGA